MWKIFSSETEDRGYTIDVYSRQIQEIKNVWNGNRYRNFGIERVVMLILAILPFTDVGLLLRNLFRGKGKLLHRKLFIDFYVVLNVLFPLCVLFLEWFSYSWIVWICVYLGFQTTNALLSMVFLHKIIPGAISHNRNLIALFLNYLQMILLFAIIYVSWGEDCFGSSGEIVKMKPLHALYLSLETFTTVGFGDIIPLKDRGYIIMIFQMLIQLIFVYIIFVIFSDKIGASTFYNKEKVKNAKEPHTVNSNKKTGA